DEVVRRERITPRRDATVALALQRLLSFRNSLRFSATIVAEDPAVQIALSVRGLNKTYHAGERSRVVAIPALRDVSLDIASGGVVGLVGRPGSGKSTML